jgi:CHASE3 domain sensor protein
MDNALVGTEEHRDSVRRMIRAEIGDAIEEEIRKAAREMAEEQRKAISEEIEEHRLAIRHVLDEEKAAIRERVQELTHSIGE